MQQKRKTWNEFEGTYYLRHLYRKDKTLKEIVKPISYLIYLRYFFSYLSYFFQAMTSGCINSYPKFIAPLGISEVVIVMFKQHLVLMALKIEPRFYMTEL